MYKLSRTVLTFCCYPGDAMYFSLITAFVLILGVTIFSLQNGKSLEVKFLAWNFETSLLGIVLAAALVGALIVAVFALPSMIKGRLREKRLVRQLQQLEKQPGPEVSADTPASTPQA